MLGTSSSTVVACWSLSRHEVEAAAAACCSIVAEAAVEVVGRVENRTVSIVWPTGSDQLAGVGYPIVNYQLHCLMLDFHGEDLTPFPNSVCASVLCPAPSFLKIKNI